MLTSTTAVLEQDVEVIGEISAEIWFRSPSAIGDLLSRRQDVLGQQRVPAGPAGPSAPGAGAAGSCRRSPGARPGAGKVDERRPLPLVDSSFGEIGTQPAREARPDSAPALVVLYRVTANVMRVKSTWRYTRSHATAHPSAAAALGEEINAHTVDLMNRAQHEGLLAPDADLEWTRISPHRTRTHWPHSSSTPAYTAQAHAAGPRGAPAAKASSGEPESADHNGRRRGRRARRRRGVPAGGDPGGAPGHGAWRGRMGKHVVRLN